MLLRFSRLIPHRFRLSILAIIVTSIASLALWVNIRIQQSCLKEAQPILLQASSQLRDLARQRYDLIRSYQFQEENFVQQRLSETADLISALCRSLDYIASRGALNRSVAQNLINQTMLNAGISEIGYAYILSLDGHIISHPKLPHDFDLSTYLFFKEMLSRKNGNIRYWWKNPGETQSRERLAVYRSIESWSWIIVLAVPITDVRNTTFEDQQLRGFYEFVKSLRLRWRGYAVILSDDQQVIAHPTHDLQTVDLVPGAVEMLASRESNCSFIDPEGKKWWAGVSYFQPWGWRIAVTAPEEEILSESRKIRNELIAFALLIIVIASVLVAMVSRRAIFHALHTARKIHHIN